ncbi:hypothetical protein GVN16_02990 [Emticicia sp. CRIBPO]|uniref:LytTR family DNA-binding domain-containing protein n=1 Tax=Emticicia sp. CRIBPO TaxID=2683258 RepID=UPI001411CECD|nr:LytTR family transcriptional regulator DNA-binding domain-containing protein [Emticicia sp. CRIBPO]NBA84705.1 hypothetical protein [Emticicia sp. CRIBPO]
MTLELILKENLSEVIFITNNHRSKKLRKENIQYIDSVDNSAVIHTIKGTFQELTRFSEFMKQLENDQEFVRVSENVAVNLNYVDSIVKYTLFIGNKGFQVAEKYRASIFEEE